MWSFRAGRPVTRRMAANSTCAQVSNTPLSFTLQKLHRAAKRARLALAEGSSGGAGTRRLALRRSNSGTRRSRSTVRSSNGRRRSASINLQIAAAYRGKKAFDAAITAYNDLLKVDPTNDKAKVGIAMASLEKGDLDTGRADAGERRPGSRRHA